MQDLQALLGLNEKGEMRLYVSGVRLNELSKMHERGQPFPHTVYQFSTQQEGEALDALRALHKYYQPKKRK
jgi:hypothetical protein